MTLDTTRLRVGVLMGGPSAEQEVSMRSGQAILEALRRSGVDAVPVKISSGVQAEEEILTAGIHCAFIALHGTFGEDGRVQALLGHLGLPYTGSRVKASQRAMDKVISRAIFRQAGLSVPRSACLNRGDLLTSLNGLMPPLVVKPARQGSSVGISLIRDLEGLESAIALAYQYGDQILVEEYIVGQELTVGILNDNPLPVIQILPRRAFFDYQAKYQPGMTEYLVPAPIGSTLTHTVQEAALRAHLALGCLCFSRVDLILNHEATPVILEVNTIPGMTTTSLLPKAARAAGISFEQLCLAMLESAERRPLRLALPR